MSRILKSHNHTPYHPDWLPHRRQFLLVPLLTLLIGLSIVWVAGSSRVIGQTVFFLDAPLTIYWQRSVGQFITPPADGLNRVDVMLVGFRKILPGSVKLRIRDTDDTELIERSVSAETIRDAWFTFEFPPLEQVAGKEIRFELRRDSHFREAAGVRVGPGNLYPGDGHFEGDRDPSFTITFRAYMPTPANLGDRWERVMAMASSLTAARPGFFGQPVTPLVLGLVYAAGLATLVVLLVGMARRP